MCRRMRVLLIGKRARSLAREAIDREVGRIQETSAVERAAERRESGRGSSTAMPGRGSVEPSLREAERIAVRIVDVELARPPGLLQWAGVDG
jgi:hypothetical protein